MYISSWHESYHLWKELNTYIDSTISIVISMTIFNIKSLRFISEVAEILLLLLPLATNIFVSWTTTHIGIDDHCPIFPSLRVRRNGLTWFGTILKIAEYKFKLFLVIEKISNEKVIRMINIHFYMWPRQVKPLVRSTRLVSKTDNVMHFARLVKQASVDLVSDLFVYYRLGCEPFVCSWGLHILSLKI